MKAKRIMGVMLALALLPPFSAAADSEERLLAFPEAEGGGKYTQGARGADEIEVYHVTNLNDSGEGSLREAVSEPGRIVVFDVSGIIELESKLTFDSDNVTVLGQTAPGDGITITGYDAEVRANDIILRYLRIRPTDSQGGEPDGLGGRWVHDVIIDHCSVSWGVDEMLTIYAGSCESEDKTPSSNITVQYCLSAESLRMSSHIKGAHGYGGIIGGTNATYHHNMFAHNDSRNPRFDRNLVSTDMVNNVIYNWGNNSAYGAEPYSYNKQEEFSDPEHVSNINIRNNYYKYGPSTRGDVRYKIFEATNDGSVMYDNEVLRSNAYINGNYVFGSEELTADNTASEESVMNRDMLNLLDEPVSMGEYEISIDSAADAFYDVIMNAGATLPRRDAVDARIAADALSGTGRIINQEEEVGGLTGIESETRVFEIPAEWKAENGMGDAEPEDIAPSGYTWIEEYVNDWTAQQAEPSNPSITVHSPAVAYYENTMDKTGGRGFWTVADENEGVVYSITAEAAEGTEIVKTEIYDGTELIYTFEGSKIDQRLMLEPGTHYLTSKAYNDRGEKTASDTSIVYVTGANGTGLKEIGQTAYPGESAKWTNDGITYIGGSGRIGGTADSFGFDAGYTNGDFSYTVKIEDIPKYENGVLCGIMFRESMEENSRFIMISDSWKKYGENIIAEARTDEGGESETLWFKDTEGNEIKNSGSYDTEKYPLPEYLRIERSGDTLRLSVSDSGTDFTDNVRQPMEFDISGWSGTAAVGLAVDSMNGRSSEGNPQLPYYTIAGFSDISTDGVHENRYTLEWGETSVSVNAVTDLRANAVLVQYDGTGKAETVSKENIELYAGESAKFDAPAGTRVYIFEN